MAGTGQYGTTDSMNDVAGETMNDVAGATMKAVEGAGENVKRIANDAAEGIQRTADYFRNNGVQKIAEDVKSYAKANPAHAVIGAVVVGFLLGRLIRRD